jgi:uncharacterized protein (TIGR03083 family)
MATASGRRPRTFDVDDELFAFVADEQRRLARTLAEVGPDAPTLCPAWSAADLAAHLAMELRFAPAIFVGHATAALLGAPLSARMPGLIAGASQRFGSTWDDAVVRLEQPPPGLWRRRPVVDVRVIETWVHHQDVLALTDKQHESVPMQVATVAPMLARLAAGRRRHITVAADGVTAVGGRAGRPQVTLTGAPWDVLMTLAGRHHATSRCSISGDGEASAALVDHRL